MLKFDFTVNIPVLITVLSILFLAIVGWDRMSNMLNQHEYLLRNQEERIRLLEKIAVKLETLIIEKDRN